MVVAGSEEDVDDLSGEEEGCDDDFGSDDEDGSVAHILASLNDACTKPVGQPAAYSTCIYEYT